MPLPPELEKQIRENIKKAEEEIKKLKPELERAKLAGIDVQDMIKELKEKEQQLQKLKLHYGK